MKDHITSNVTLANEDGLIKLLCVIRASFSVFSMEEMHLQKLKIINPMQFLVGNMTLKQKLKVK